jgi:hypothetical protein
MCAIDALGIAAMFDEPIEIASRDPLTQEEIQVELQPDGDGNWQPQEAVVVAGASRGPPVLRGRTSGVRRRLRVALMPRPADRDTVQRLLAERAQLVEVLPAAEYEDEHLPGAINIPLKELNAETARQLKRGQPVIVYCHDYQ